MDDCNGDDEGCKVADSFGLRASGYERATSRCGFSNYWNLGLIARSKRAARSSKHTFYRPKYFAFRSVYSFHFSGRSSSAKIAETGHTGTHAPQSMHSTGSI